MSLLQSTHHNVLLHSGIATSGSSGGGLSRGILIVAARLEVVGHVGIELLGSLLCRAGVATTALLGSASLSGSGLGVSSSLLCNSSRLGLRLWPGSTLSQALGGRDDHVGLRSADDNLDLRCFVNASSNDY